MKNPQDSYPPLNMEHCAELVTEAVGMLRRSAPQLELAPHRYATYRAKGLTVTKVTLRGTFDPSAGNVYLSYLHETGSLSLKHRGVCMYLPCEWPQTKEKAAIRDSVTGVSYFTRHAAKSANKQIKKWHAEWAYRISEQNRARSHRS